MDAKVWIYDKAGWLTRIRDKFGSYENVRQIKLMQGEKVQAIIYVSKSSPVITIQKAAAMIEIQLSVDEVYHF